MVLIRRSSWKKVAVFFPGKIFRKIGTYFCRSFAISIIGFKPAANQGFGLVVGLGSVFIRILLDDRRSSVVDLSGFGGVLVVRRPELGRFGLCENQIGCNELFLDRTNVLAQKRQLLIRERIGGAVGSGWLRRRVLGVSLRTPEYTDTAEQERRKYDFLQGTSFLQVFG